ncbi:TPR-like protein [Neoconidiobolus thromboides FSU 785]|nr:TPR-like protein [Neoconidiobolus thromboides FSU 785]
MSSRAKSLEKDIERTRLLGSWAELPELARKYKKHESQGAALQHLILSEHSLYQVTDDFDPSKHALDHPNHILIPKDSTTMNAINLIIDNADIAIRSCSQLSTDIEKSKSIIEQANIIKSKAYFGCGEYSEAEKVLQELSLSGDVSLEGYHCVLYIQALNIMAMCFELKNEFKEASEYYQKGLTILKNYSGDLSDKIKPEFQKTIENVFYRHSLIALRLEEYQTAINVFRFYFSESNGWNKIFRPHRQRLLLRYYILVLTQTYQRGEHIPCYSSYTANPPEGPNSLMSVYTPAAFRDELSNVQTRYEGYIYQLSSFPTAGSINPYALDMADQMMMNWSLMKNSRAIDTQNLVDSLYRVAKFTYQSPRVLRHLATALIALGEYEEAKLALDSYVQLVEKSIEVKESCILGPTQEKDSFSEFTLDSAELEFRRSLPPEDKELLAQVIETYLISAKLHIQEFDDYELAIKLAEMAIEHCETRPNHHLALLSRAYQHLGVAKGYLSMKADNHATRTQFHIQSLSALEKAIKMDSDNWEAHFFLGLQQAEGRAIEEAIQSVKQSLELYSSYTPAWHLLVLLMSCQKQFDQALSICEVAMREAEREVDPEKEDTEQEGEELLGLLTTNLDGEDLLSLKLTYNCLQEAALGTKIAINHHGSLFTLYAKVYGSSEAKEGNQMSKNKNFDESLSGSKLNNSTFPRSRVQELNSAQRPASIAGNYSSKEYGTIQSGTKGPYSGQSRGYASSTLASLSSPYSMHISTRSLPRLLSRRKRGVQVLVSLWLHSSQAYYKLGRYKDAKLACEEAESIDPSSADIWSQYGKIFLAQKQYENAITCLNRATILDAAHTEALTYLGQCYLELNKLDMAESCLRSVTDGPGWSSALGWFLLGRTHRESKLLKKANSCMVYALDLNLSAPVRPFHILWSLRNLS